MLAALVSGGHVLFEDVPGTAKTVLARAIAGSIDGAIPSRIQCTPDLQPTDVTGLSVFNQELRRFEFQPGPLFANIVLVDEINRAMPKTQSALLEAMAEHQVTVDGVTRPLARAVPADRDREPDRVRGHLPAAGGAARPLLRPHEPRLSGRGGGAARSCASSGTDIRSTRSDRSCRVEEIARSAPRQRGRLRRRAARSLDRPARARDARRSTEVEVGRLGSRLARAHQGRARLGAPPRPDVRHARRHRRAVRAGARPPPDARARDTSPRRGTSRATKRCADQGALPRARAAAAARLGDATRPPHGWARRHGRA